MLLNANDVNFLLQGPEPLCFLPVGGGEGGGAGGAEGDGDNGGEGGGGGGDLGHDSGGDYLEDFAEKKTLYIHSYIRISIQPKTDSNPS